mmetsp:Transcript_20542/g.59592  ORF Transcript_20542/g.59592 Transcript_20542/m.59592 type:complete len:252 (-) Transcript_20542:491-1246(-)
MDAIIRGGVTLEAAELETSGAPLVRRGAEEFRPVVGVDALRRYRVEQAALVGRFRRVSVARASVDDQIREGSGTRLRGGTVGRFRRGTLRGRRRGRRSRRGRSRGRRCSSACCSSSRGGGRRSIASSASSASSSRRWRRTIRHDHIPNLVSISRRSVPALEGVHPNDRIESRPFGRDEFRQRHPDVPPFLGVQPFSADGVGGNFDRAGVMTGVRSSVQPDSGRAFPSRESGDASPEGEVSSSSARRRRRRR